MEFNGDRSIPISREARFGVASGLSANLRMILPGYAFEAPQTVKCDASGMRTLRNTHDRDELCQRLTAICANTEPLWGKMSAHQMICHLNDSLRAALGEKYISQSTSLFKRAILKPLALWAPIPWPHGFKTRPELDQDQGGTPPVEFAADLAEFHRLLERFCAREGEFAPHAMWGQMSKAERLRYAYLHMDHHLRQFGV